jgi:hypothetical protein
VEVELDTAVMVLWALEYVHVIWDIMDLFASILVLVEQVIHAMATACVPALVYVHANLVIGVLTVVTHALVAR